MHEYEWCTRVQSGARDYGALYEYGVVHEKKSSRLGMEPPGEAVEVKVETSLGEVLSRWRQVDD